MTRTPMARLPWMIRTGFWVPTKLFRYLILDFFLFYHEIIWCVYLLESPHQGDSYECYLRKEHKKRYVFSLRIVLLKMLEHNINGIQNMLER